MFFDLNLALRRPPKRALVRRERLAIGRNMLSSLREVDSTRNQETAAARRDTPAGMFHFCSTRCAATFDTDPDRYTAAALTHQ